MSISLSVKDSALHNKSSRCAAEHTSRGAAHLAAGCEPEAAIESIFQRAVEVYIKSRTPSLALSDDILRHMAERLGQSQVAWLAQRRTQEACDEKPTGLVGEKGYVDHVCIDGAAPTHVPTAHSMFKHAQSTALRVPAPHAAED